MKTVNIINLGCAKNLVDSEHLARQLQINGLRVLFDHPELQDYNLINTCGFIHDARQESIDTILNAVHLKQEKQQEAFIGVFGCLTQLYKAELKSEIPEIDAWFGKYNINEIVKTLQGTYKLQHANERITSTPAHYAYLKIAEGCHRKCAFCSIPAITGTYHSVPAEKLIEEAGFLASKGVKELILIAQDLTWYGRDLPGTPTLTGLIRQLSAIQGIEWIRLHYAYPAGIPGDLFDEMRENPKVCRYLDIPFQHIADPVLQNMKRGHTRQSTIELLQTMRQKVPGIAIRTTLMVGFPGETAEQFEELKAFLHEARFDRMGAFTYAHEAFTSAYEQLEDNMPETVKTSRFDSLMASQYDISLALNRKKIGKKMPVIIDRKENNVYFGRSEFDSPGVDGEIIIEHSDGLTVGDFAEVEITGSEAFDLYGKVTGYAGRT